jgi:hypothetical protein
LCGHGIWQKARGSEIIKPLPLSRAVLRRSSAYFDDAALAAPEFLFRIMKLNIVI